MILIKELNTETNIYTTLLEGDVASSNDYNLKIYRNGFEIDFTIFDHNLGSDRSNLFNLIVVDDLSNQDLTNPSLIKVYVYPGEYKYVITDILSSQVEQGIFKVLSTPIPKISYDIPPTTDKYYK